MIIRQVKEKDTTEILELYKSCFGRLDELKDSILPNGKINKNYKVVIEDNKIVAVGGIVSLEESRYQGYEVGWVCTDIHYRNKGYMIEILKQSIKELPEDNLPIYCDCWRIQSNPFINMIYVMQKLGFKEVLRDTNKYKALYSKDCLGCLYEQADCYCSTDLWKLDRHIDLT